MSQSADISFLQNSPAIQSTDSNGNVVVYHYVPDCNDTYEAQIKQVRGWIIDTQSKEILVKTFTYVPEFTLQDTSRIQTSLQQLGTNIVFTPSYEGSLIHIWNQPNTGVWHISTAKKLNAFSSRWGSKFSLGEQFYQCLLQLAGQSSDATTFETLFQQFTASLHPQHIYAFQLRSCDENRIVCRGYPQVDCFFVGLFDRSNNFQFFLDRPSIERFFPSIPTYNDIENMDMLYQKVNDIDPYREQGILVMNAQGEALKIYNQRYYDLLQVRAFSPNHLMRYINILKSKDQAMLQQFKDLYSERSNEWKDFHRIIHSMAKNIQHKYIKRYIERKMALLPPEQHGIMKEVYSRCWIKGRQNVTNDIVEQTIYEYDAPLIHKMYEQFKRREEQHGDGNHVNEQDMSRVHNA